MPQETAPRSPSLVEMIAEWEKQGLSEAQIHKQVGRYLSTKARKRGVPLNGIFELTPLCNLDCKMCYVHLTREQLRRSDRKPLSTAQWKDIMQQAIDAGMIGATLTGGEAMMHPGFDELYLFLCEKGIEIDVKTNGLLLTEERAAFFKEYPPIGMQVTLYGSNDDAYERVTGHRSFQQALDGIRRAKEAGLYPDVMITPNRYGKEDTELLLKRVHEFGVHYHINPGLERPREETGRTDDELDLSLDDYIAIYKMDANLQGRALQISCAEEVPSGGGEKDAPSGLRCGGGRSGFAVNWRGEMMPCLSLREITVDLTRTKLSDAWKRIYDAVTVYPLPRECVGCAYQRICPSCVVKHACGAPIGHANPALCEKVKRLVREGLIILR